MAEYLAPGLFLEERSNGPAVIQGVSTSNFGSVAWTPRGPTGVATLVTSFDEFITKFGTYWANSYIAYSMAAFFQNGGSRAYFVREVPSDAASASGSIEDAAQGAEFIGWQVTDPILTLDATHYNIKIQVDAFAATEIDVTGDSGVTGSYALSTLVSNINTALNGVDVSLVNTCSEATEGGGDRLKFVSPTTGASSEIEFTAPASNDATELLLGLLIASYPHSFTGAASVNRWDWEASSEGVWGNLVKCVIQGDDNYQDVANGGYTKYKVLVQEETSDAAADFATVESIGPVTLASATASDYIVDVVADKSDLITVAEGTSPGVPWELEPVTRTAEAIVKGDGATASYSGTLLYPAVVRGSLVITDGVEPITDQGDGTMTGTLSGTGTIDYTTGAWTVVFTSNVGNGDMISATYDSVSAESESSVELSGGLDGTSLTRTQVSAPALEATLRGIYAMNKIEDVINVALPDFAGSTTVAGDLIAWAEARKDRFIILETESDMTPQEAVDYRRYTLAANTSYAGLYWPWVEIQDPNTLLAKNIPPSGFVAGVFARTDQVANVSTAPAGMTRGKLVGANGLEYDATFGEREILSPAAVNCLVDTPQTGRAVWDCLTLSLDSQWALTQVRRLFMFVEKSVWLSTFWAVFEDNGPALWSRIRMSLNGFLGPLYDNNYFGGTSPETSYRVVCDSSNNSQADIDNNLMTVDVYIKPKKAARFIRIRFTQMVNQSA